MNQQQSIKTVIEGWKEELHGLKEQLIVNGGQPNTMEYNLLSCEALRLSMCLNDLTEFLLAQDEAIQNNCELQKEEQARRKDAANRLQYVKERFGQKESYPIDQGGEVKF